MAQLLPAAHRGGRHQRTTRGGFGVDGDWAAFHDASWFEGWGSFERWDGS
jgi:hypothetical protein